MSRLLADEHFPVKIVYFLRKLGHDVVTVREVGISKYGDSIPDDLILQFAAQQRRTVLTFNERDFRRLHGESASHSGILCCTAPPARRQKKFARHIDSFFKQTPMNSRLEILPPMPSAPAR